MPKSKSGKISMPSKANKTDFLLKAHKEGVFVLKHPQASKPTLMSIEIFADVFHLKDLEGFKSALYETLGEEREIFVKTYGDVDVYFTKALDIISVYLTLGKALIFQ